MSHGYLHTCISHRRRAQARPQCCGRYHYLILDCLGTRVRVAGPQDLGLMRMASPGSELHVQSYELPSERVEVLDEEFGSGAYGKVRKVKFGGESTLYHRLY